MTLELPGLEVALDILLVNLVDGQFAEEGLGLVESICSVGLQDLPQSIGPELRIVDDVFVILVEDVVQDALSLDVQG